MRVINNLTTERVREICDRLLAEQEALKTFSASLEQEFLDLGSLIRKISSLSREVQNQSDDVRLVTVGTPLGCPMEFAFKLLEKAEDLAKVTHAQNTSVASLFEGFQIELFHISSERDALLGAFARIHLGNEQFRIEAAYLDTTTRTQLFTLVDAGEEILKALQTKIALRFEPLGSLLCTIGALNSRFKENIKVREKSTEESLRSDQTDLTSLNEALLRSQGFASINLRGRLNIAGGVRKAMVALQCQDITRQKIEHINSGIEEMVSHLTTGVARKLTKEEEADCRHYLSDAGKIQLAQLRGTFQQLFDAAKQVKEALDQVSAETQAGAKLSPESRKTLLENQVFERGLGSLSVVIELLEGALSDWTEAATLNKVLKPTFTNCTADLMALTNQLRAIHEITLTFLGAPEGRSALKAVIREQHALLDTATNRTLAIEARANALVSALPELETRLQGTVDFSRSERSELDPKVNSSKAQLAGMKEELHARVLSIRPLEQELAKAVDLTEKRIRFPQAVAEISTRSLALFEKIIGDYQADSTVSQAPSKPHAKVSQLKRHYTMVDEHTVHDQSVGSESAIKEKVNEASVTLFEDEPVATSPAQPAEDALADNVELF